VVRTSGDKSAPAKATKKRSTKGRSAIDDREELARPASTLVSSPVRRSAVKSKKGKAVANFFDEEAIAEDEEHYDLDHEPVLHYNGYEQDDFCVPDDEEDDFEPVRKTAIKSRRQRTLEELGPPISRTAEDDALDDVHSVMVAAFLVDAKDLEEQLRNNKGFRRPLFTETQLRQMAIRWTTTVEEMRRIPGIKSDYVDKFGAKFTLVVKKFYDNYREMMGQGRDAAMATIPGTARPSSAHRAAEPQSDIIDLISDDDEDDDYEDPGVPSKYFGGATNDPIQSQLEGWSQRYAATTQLDDSGPVSRGRNTSKRGGFRKNYNRKGGGGSRSGGRSYGGVSKGKSRRTSGGSSKAGAGGRGGSRSGGGARGGGAGGSGIAVMPF
jgi:bloom syndrome protein